MLKGKNILLAVCGGIAVYKVVDVASRLRKLGANVHVVMTKEATKFCYTTYISRNQWKSYKCFYVG